MNRFAPITIGSVAGVLFMAPAATLACIFETDDMPAFLIRAKSEPVEIDSQCRMINGGVRDSHSLGPAVDLDKGRFYQIVDESPSLALLGDCNTREVTILIGPVKSIQETSCGPDHEFASVVSEGASFSLADGEDLHELVAIATTHKAREINPNERFFEFTKNYGDTRIYKVGKKDRFDLLCGCKIHYPDSAGAKR